MASDDPFISVQDLSDYSGRDLSADNAAIAVVDAACQICRDVADCNFNQVIGDTIVLDGTGTDCLMLPEMTVSKAGTVTLAGSALVENSEYVLASGGRLIRTTTLGGSASYTTFTDYNVVWPAGRQNVHVTYDHGFAGTAPTSVRRVALGLAYRMLFQQEAVMQQLATRQSITYKAQPMDLSPGERLILEGYRPR